MLRKELNLSNEKSRPFASVIKDILDISKDAMATKNFVRKEIADVKTTVAESKAEIIKWMFIFWIGQVGLQ